MNQSDRKKLRSVTAGMTAIALLTTGTFAWNAFSQDAINETVGGSLEAAGRLHDDFNGKNKDVYIENYSEVGEGGAIYARVRLDEYMELGDGAGTDEAMDDESIVVLRGDKAKGEDITPLIDDVSTWDTYLYNSTSQGEDIRNYRGMSFGGSTVYLPTFNKNIDSLASDINGTLAGPDGLKFEGDDEYGDYYQYTEGEEVTQVASYDLDDNDIDEGEVSIEGTNHELIEETHVAKTTKISTIMTMSEWEAAGSLVGPYWVYDTDGWAYWAQAIRPQTATGLLLTGVHGVKNPRGDWYYGVNVVAEMATADDWGKKEDNDGFYQNGITDNALALLNGAVEYYEITSVFDGIEVGSSSTGSVDGVAYYVLDEMTDEQGRDMVMIYAEGAVGPIYRFHGTSYEGRNSLWSTSDLRTYMNGDFITTYMSSLVGKIADTSLETPKLTNTSGSYETTTDKVFPLTIEDLGWESSAVAGTTVYPTVVDALVSSDKVSIAVDFWLRSPYSNIGTSTVNEPGYLGASSTNLENSVRPALWIYL